MSHKGDYNPEHRRALIFGVFTFILILILIVVFIVRESM